MPFTTESGTIIEVLRGPRAVYRVRLASGREVYVGNDQVVPLRVTLLPVHEILWVTYNDQGKVTSAQWKDSISGRVVGMEGYGPRLEYSVQLLNGATLLISRQAIDPHPDRTVVLGAELEVSLVEGRVKRARLLLERLAVEVLSVDLGKGTALVRGRQGDRYMVRMRVEDLRQVAAGAQLLMEIHYSETGERRIVLERAGGVQERQAPSARPLEPPPVGAPPTARPTTPLAEAQIAGIDPLYLAERRREHHRPEIMSFLEEHSRDGLVEWYRMRESIQARYSQPSQPLPNWLEVILQQAEPNFKGFYLHQALALDAIRAGRHLVIVTQTASGKTLSYNPAIFERLSQEPGAHALYLFPLNALMTDQKEKIDVLCKLFEARGMRVSAEHLRGGMGADRQEIARRCPNILATNPEMLSVVLNEASRWATFFRGLRYIVVDEVHSYRGIFGVHMSGLLRRLLLAARRFGAQPQLVLCSATVSNPLDLAERLTSLPRDSFTLIAEKEDGSRQDCKHWAVLNPEWGASRSRYDHYLDVAAQVFIELISGRRTRGSAATRGDPGGLNTILFARSIRDVNRLYRLVNENLRQRDPALLRRVKSYVSAELSVADKREIYEGLRSGQMVGVISTNALEAGIDIGRLDACIIAGFPFSVMRMRQMSGRVGRQNEGLVLFVPYPLSGLDGYYHDHPELLLSQPPEEFVVDPENPYVARKHINAAAYALGGLESSTLRSLWGARGETIAQQAVSDGVMRRSNGRYFGTRRDYANLQDVYAVHSLRSNNQRPYAICLDKPEEAAACQLKAECFSQQRRACPRQVNVLDQMYVYRDCHPGAVYEANGRLYKVVGFDDANRSVRVKELPDDHSERTFVDEEVMVAVNGEPQARKTLRPGVELLWGDVTVTRLFTGYRVQTLIPARVCRRCRKEFGAEVLACPTCGRMTAMSYGYSKAERQEFPGEYRRGFEVTLKTVACWLSVDPALEQELMPASPCKLPGETNRVQSWLKTPLDLKKVKLQVNEQKLLEDYHRQSGDEVRSLRLDRQEMALFPGLYGQCLLHTLRASLGESQSLDVFQQATGYPVTDELRHVCRKCQSSVLMEALHTLEHAILLRYPSVALGDLTDLGSFSTLGHAGVGLPAVFWFDDYEGGLGAAEKIYERFVDILGAAAAAAQTCACTSLEGCPRCTHLGGCFSGNDALSKPAFLALAAWITGQPYSPGSRPFIYHRKRAADFSRAYRENEWARARHGLGEEAPSVGTAPTPAAHQILRIQPRVHESVARKAFEMRSQEIAQEVPPVSAVDLTHAYRQVLGGPLSQDWDMHRSLTPYQVLEVLPSASLKMIQQIYRVIALQVHPDAHPDRAAWATEMMKIVNAAYDAIQSDKKS